MAFRDTQSSMGEALGKETRSPRFYLTLQLILYNAFYKLQPTTAFFIAFLGSFRCSLYTDEVVIFMGPICKDISTLAEILDQFIIATGLTTNFEKSLVAPTRCGAIDHEDVLTDFLAITSL
jgi:hypothetical protein